MTTGSSMQAACPRLCRGSTGRHSSRCEGEREAGEREGGNGPHAVLCLFVMLCMSYHTPLRSLCFSRRGWNVQEAAAEAQLAHLEGCHSHRHSHSHSRGEISEELPPALSPEEKLAEQLQVRS